MERDPPNFGASPESVTAQLSQGAILGDRAGTVGKSLAEAWFRAAIRRAEALRPGDAKGFLSPSADNPRLDGRWLPELGAAHAFADVGLTTEAWLQSALGIAAAGADVNVRARLSRPRRVRFAGHALSLRGQITLRADDEALHLFTADGVARFNAVNGGWALAGSEGLVITSPYALIDDDLPGRYVVLWRGNPLSADAERAGLSVGGLSNEDLRDAAASIVDAFRAITAGNSGNGAWMTPLFREAAAYSPQDGSVEIEAAAPLGPGVIPIPLPLDGHALSEALIFGCSRQYLHLASYFAPLHSGRDSRVYDSIAPPAGSIDAILPAFHANANATLFWYDVVSRGGAAAALRSLARSRERVVDLADPLRRSDGLTPLGVAIWQIQWAALAERGLVPADTSPRP